MQLTGTSVLPRVAAFVLVAGLAACTQEDAPRAVPTRTVPTPTKTTERPVPVASERWFRDACDLSIPILRRIRRGYAPDRSPDVMFVPKLPHYFEGFAHAGPWPYLQRVPFAFYGPGILESAGSVSAAREVTMADLAPTVAELIGAELPSGRPGRPVADVTDAVAPDAATPTLVVTAVMDGGGWNVLERWPRRWPFLGRMMGEGISVTNATVGSSPSVTPPIHATLGTGTFPRDHGIVDIPVRDGDVVEDSWEGENPSNLAVTTLADEYDLATDNRAVIGMIGESRWHLGMIGHGAAHEGGDRDIAVLSDLDSAGGMYTNERFYELPGYVEDRELFADLVDDVDLWDGVDDGTWRGRDLSDLEDLRFTPVWAAYQRPHIEEVIEREGFGEDDVADLLFLNYKFIDHAGHKFTLDSPEMERAVAMTDNSLRVLVDQLDETVGEGEWILVITADHGVQPLPPRGRLIRQNPLSADVEERFGAEQDRLVLEDRALGIWLARDYAAGIGITVEEIARYLNDYSIGDDLRPGETLRPYWSADERLFEAAFPSRYLDEIWDCATGP
ncbi:MAG: alkaline phosphatase family protein [Actinomycetota bacterium]